MLRNQSTSAQESPGSSSAGHAARQRADRRRLAGAHVVAEGQLRQSGAHAQQPRRLGGGRERPGHAEARRDGKTVADVALAVAEHLVVDGKHQRVVS